MARQPKPWFREDRRVWCVTITGKHHNLGRNKKEAFKKFSVLMQMPKQRQPVERNSMLSTNSSTGISITAQKRLLNGTRQHLQNFVSAHCGLEIENLRPHDIEQWSASPNIAI